MANPNPELFTIKVGVKRIESPTNRKPLSAALTFDVTRRPRKGGDVAVRILDPQNLVVRPGDAIEFELGEIEFEVDNPTLRIDWKPLNNFQWPDAPKQPGKPVAVPGRKGFAGKLFSFSPTVDLGVNLKLPAQRVSDNRTLVTIDPTVIVDEC